MDKYRLILDLQFFAEKDAAGAGVEDASAAGGQQPNDVPADQTGVETPAAAEPEGQKDVEKAFAKRLAAERAKWEQEQAEMLKEFEAHKRVSEFFQQYNGMDLNALLERIELEQLKQQAEQQQVPVEVMRRIQELEQKAALAEQLAQQQAQAQWEKTYREALNAYVQGKEGDAEAINKYLVGLGITVDPNRLNDYFDMAFRALKYEELVKKLESAEKDGMKKLLESKGSIPANVGSTTGQGQVSGGPPKTFAEARARALARLGVTEI